MKKIMFYCQHILGMGHLIRSKALVEGVDDDDFEVCFINGGEMVPGFELPDTVTVVNLPPITSDVDFKAIQSVNGKSLADIQAERTGRLLAEFERFRPDAVVIELFPFGRKKFAFELLPLLARIRVAGRQTKVICSLRDILVSRSDQEKYEERVVRLMRRYFDALLVHADPQFQRLEETFQLVADLDLPVVYTGYVAQRATALAASNFPIVNNGEPLILVSIGGGRVGHELVSAAIDASALLQEELAHHMLIFTGPFLPTEHISSLQSAVAGQPQITLRSYTRHFADYMKRADLSVSMAGYNTCMDILSAGTRALVLPFTGGGNDEQTIRARKLEALGVVGVITPEELNPAALAARMKAQLQAAASPASLDMRGVPTTTQFIHNLLATPSSTPSPQHRFAPAPAHFAPLRAALDRRQVEQRLVHFFVRDDDVDEDEESLRQLLDIALSRGVPLNLEVIPGRLTREATKLLKEIRRSHPALIELNQHGWQHVNHEANGRKCEFGLSRTFEQQLADIAQGKRLLEKTFGAHFYPVFTPPWNRCTEDTFAALDRLGFAALSRDRGAEPAPAPFLRELPITLDIFRWRGNRALKSADEIIASLVDQLDASAPIGLMLHHKVMDDAAFSFVDWLLGELRRHPIVRFHTFASLNWLPELEGVAGGR